MTKLLLTAALLFTGCLDAESTEHTIDFDEAVLAEGLTAEQLDQCSQVVASDGACAVACVPEEVMKYVPSRTCASFVCTLGGGGTLHLNGCNTESNDRPAIELGDLADAPFGMASRR
jgi:hypothetical protein